MKICPSVFGLRSRIGSKIRRVVRLANLYSASYSYLYLSMHISVLACGDVDVTERAREGFYQGTLVPQLDTHKGRWNLLRSVARRIASLANSGVPTCFMLTAF